jgi:hypothetical protein
MTALEFRKDAYDPPFSIIFNFCGFFVPHSGIRLVEFASGNCLWRIHSKRFGDYDLILAADGGI